MKVAEGLNVAYIMGSGDDVPASLEALGIHVNFLAPNDVATADLSRYNVILLGVRTYAAREELKTYNSRLLDYVKNGGVLVVQYNTPEYDHNFGPYPYVMGGNPEEVTDEASRMDILDPRNPIFLWPNPITQRDFEGWVEERGSKLVAHPVVHRVQTVGPVEDQPPHGSVPFELERVVRGQGQCVSHRASRFSENASGPSSWSGWPHIPTSS